MASSIAIIFGTRLRHYDSYLLGAVGASQVHSDGQGGCHKSLPRRQQHQSYLFCTSFQTVLVIIGIVYDIKLESGYLAAVVANAAPLRYPIVATLTGQQAAIELLIDCVGMSH